MPKFFGNILQFPLGTHFGIVIVHFPNEIPNREIDQQLIKAIKELSAK